MEVEDLAKDTSSMAKIHNRSVDDEVRVENLHSDSPLKVNI